ncbi:hypothetical protein niasHS_007712 [Heterodera schachtii]|uniref:AH domain-containing protein n=1 Tax=Heterodera schachtii TaxID=97005 RepID=A0ABD2JPH2_HETSC
MASFYEASTSGMNWDRFSSELDDSLLNDSTTLKVKKAFWSAKQLLREKLGKREDEHIVAADAELDTHLQTFRQIRDSTQNLLNLMETHQRELNELAQLELDIAELLNEEQKDEKAHLRKVLQVAGNAETNSSKQRHILLGYVTQFGNVLYDFIERAVSDCEQTVDAVGRARLDYRGSLLWLKKCSETLDPGDSSHMEDFRKVQHVVKCQKHRLDQLKEDMAMKVGLKYDHFRTQLLIKCKIFFYVSVLQSARNGILADNLEEYKTALLTFHSENAAEFCASSEQFDGLESYEIDVLKILNDPIGSAMEDQRRSHTTDGVSKPDKLNTSRPSSARRRQLSAGSDNTDLVELEEVELGVGELLRFEDDAMIGMAQPADQVRLKCPAATSSESIGLNLLKHSSSSTANLLDDLQHGWDSIGCSSAALYDLEHKTENAETKSQLNSCDFIINAQSAKHFKPEKSGGALLEEIEDLLFESCPSSPNMHEFGTNNNGNERKSLLNIVDIGGGAENMPKLAPAANGSATHGKRRKD